MARQNSQQKRVGQLITETGRDRLLLRQFDGTEHVDDLFLYRVEAQSDDLTLSLDELLGTHATVAIETEAHGTRHFDGIVTAGHWVGSDGRVAVFRLTLEPWFALLAQRHNSRIFHEMDVKQILEAVFQPYAGLGNPAVELALTGSYPELEYTVQYRESDLQFARRQMERFGLSFHFQHSEGAHKMTIVDAVDSYQDVPGDSRDYLDISDMQRANEEHFSQWEKSRSMTTGKVRLKDFDFKKPGTELEISPTGDTSDEVWAREAYLYPGDYLNENDGRAMAGLRVRQVRGSDHRHLASGNCVSLGAGMKVELTGQAAEQVVGKVYLCLSASHKFRNPAYHSDDDDVPSYEGSYSFVPIDAPYAAPLQTPRAVVQGPQTAIVVGDGEVQCDEFGRVRVRFHWDLDGANSMLCRVSQNWAGKGWGGMVIPRVGMEVVVEFLEGDPDKPLITGCVYNGSHAAPYELPAHKMRSTFRSSVDNELRFEDKSGKEEVLLRGPGDWNTRFGRNRSTRVNAHTIESVGKDKASEVGNNFYQVAGGDMTLFVGPGGKGKFTPDDADEQAEGLGAVAAGLGSDGTGTGNLSITVEGDKSQNIRNDFNTTVGQTLKLSVGDKLQIDAGTQIALTCGGASIVLKQDGTIELKGTRVVTEGSAQVTIKGGVVKIN